MKEWVKAREWAYRAYRTFIQAFVAYISVNVVVALSGVDYTNKETIKTALIGLLIPAFSAGIAAVMNRNKKEDS